MTETVAKLRVGSKHYEILVDLDEALKIKKDQGGDINTALLTNNIFYDAQKGLVASQSDMKDALKTTDIYEAATRIIQKGEINLTQEHRDEERDKKKRQIIEWFVRNSVDARTDRPFLAETISSALDQIGANIDNSPIDQQIKDISEALKTIIPIKIETKKLKITIPAQYTGKVYGIVNDYKEKEDWLSDGSLSVVVNVPVGMQMEFYDKLNGVTHGAALSEEIKEE